MKKLSTFIRRSMHTIVYSVVILVVVLYLAIHFNLAGLTVDHLLTHVLEDKLNTRVTIDGKIEVDWRNQVVLNRLTIYDQQDDTLFYARRVLLAYDVLPLFRHNLVLNTCQLIDFKICAKKQETSSVANYQFVLDALQSKNPDSQSFIEEVDLNAILFRQGKLSYNQYSIEKLSANLHLHDKQLQMKKIHFSTNDADIKINKCNIHLDHIKYLKEKSNNVLDIFDLKGLQIDHPNYTCSAMAKGSSEGIAIEIQKAQLIHGNSTIKGLHSAALKSSIFISDLNRPIDSLQLIADIHEADLKTDTVGAISLQAHLEGMPCNAVATGNLSTDKGSADINSHIVYNTQSRNLFLEGHCKTQRFDLNGLIPASIQLGAIALNADYKIKKGPESPLWVALNGHIDELNYRQYAYHDVQINAKGSLINGFVGSISVDDPMAQADLTFDLDLSQTHKRYKIDGSVKHIQPFSLHLTESALFDSLAISSKIHADLLSNGWQETEGEVQLTEILLERNNKELSLEPILFEGTANSGLLSSQLIQMQYRRNQKSKIYSTKGRIPVLNEIAELLNRPERMTNDAHFSFEIDSTEQIKNLTLDCPTLFLDENRRVSLFADMAKDEHGALLPIVDFSVGNGAHGLSGTLKGEVLLDPMELTLYPTTLLYNNREELVLKGGHFVQTEDGSYAVQDFSIEGNDQSVSASGIFGKNGSKDFIVQLDRFELGQIFKNFNKNYVQFRGRATGDIVFSSDPSNELSTQDLHIENFTYIDTLIGDARLDLDFLFDKKIIDIDCRFVTDSLYHSHAYGQVKLGKNDSLDLFFDTDRLPLGYINNWTGNILQKFTGTISGQTRLFGDAGHLELSGHPRVDGKFTHSLLDAYFHFDDTVHLEHNLLYLSDVTFDDCHGHPMTVNAQVRHDHLSNFVYDVNLLMPEANQGFLVLDRKQAPGRIYWGQLYASGQAQLRGGNGQHRINLNVSTTDKSWFYLSPREQSFEQDDAVYTFLSFRNKDTFASNDKSSDSYLIKPLTYEEMITSKSETQKSPTDLLVDMQINATDQCQVYVQMDPLAEDKLSCRGHGNLALHYDPRRDISLAGTYNISSGSYSMNVRGDLMNKVFQLDNTSTVRFSGVPSEAELALDAHYSIPSVNLRDLDEGITTLGSLSRSSVPVDCKLAVTGQLSSPQVSFDLDVKNVSDEIQAYVHNVIGTQEMLNQEVLFLLLFSKFYTPQYVQSTQTRSGSELTSFASASITSQLNQLLSHISSNFSMGTNFRSERGDFSDMEMDLTLSTRLLDDRLLLNGNVGYRDPANHFGASQSKNSFIGDFDLEFMINQRGTLRVKAYSHYNERDYSINNALTTQGIGFIMRKDFKTLYELLKRRKK